MTKIVARDSIYRSRRIPRDRSALGAAVRARVREALGSVCPACTFIMQGGRDGVVVPQRFIACSKARGGHRAVGATPLFKGM
jgi:hypothetical protein